MRKIVCAVVTVLLITMLSVAVSAEITLTFSLEDVYTLDTDEAAKAIVAKITDTEGYLQGLKTQFTFDNNILIPVDAYDGTVSEDFSADAEVGAYPFDLGNVTTRKEVELTPNYPKFVFDGENSTLDVEVYYTAEFDTTDFTVWTMYVKFADGKSEEDFTADSFKLTFAEYGNGITVDNHFHYYGHSDASYNDITVVNNVVPEAVAITIPVAAGDIVYLQDGTSAVMAEANDAYEVPATVGYIAVNTAKTAQKTYYVDGSSATLVHTNAVVGSDDLSLRTPDDEWNGEDRSGLRFKMTHNNTTREVGKGETPVTNERDVVTEVGFLMTALTDKVVESIGESPVITMGMNYVLSGKAYSTETGEDKAMNTETDGAWIITGVFYGVPLTTANVQVPLISRPYYKVGDTYIYGEQTQTTLFDTAKAIKASEGFDSMTQDQIDYVNEIIALVETDVVEGEVIIDVSGLYVTAG